MIDSHRAMSGRLQTIERIFHEAVERPEPERRAFLQSSCRGDDELLREIESLLEHHAAKTSRLLRIS